MLEMLRFQAEIGVDECLLDEAVTIEAEKPDDKERLSQPKPSRKTCNPHHASIPYDL